MELFVGMIQSSFLLRLVSVAILVYVKCGHSKLGLERTSEWVQEDGQHLNLINV
jgi:hypothetical protein